MLTRRFSLASLLLIVTLVSLLFGWKWREVNEKRQVMEWLQVRADQGHFLEMHEVLIPHRRSWIDRLVAGEWPFVPAAEEEVSELVVGCSEEEIERVKQVFPEAVINIYTPPSALARRGRPMKPPEVKVEVDRLTKLSTGELASARTDAADRWWKELEMARAGNDDVAIRDLYAASLQLRDAELAAATDQAGRIAARREHMLRMQRVYLYTNALYHVGANGGAAKDEAQAHVRWIEAELELREEAGRK